MMEDYENVNIHFILRGIHKSEDDCPEEMLLSYKWCIENNVTSKWVKEHDCLDLKPGKKDVFVFEKFDGDAFVYLQNFKSIILGPRALLACISDEKPIPKTGSTIFTTAMRDCIVSCTSLDENEKENVQKKVTHMGGSFDSKRLLRSTTHLVAGNVRSNKYQQAVDAEIPVMSTQWVEAVWEASLKRNIQAGDKEFERFKCPAFLGLNITASNIPRKEKEKIKSLIEANGGVFQPMLVGHVTNMLVIKGCQGDKYKFAREYGLPCVEAEWIYESARLGHAIETKLYDVSGRGCSTPVNDNKTTFLPDVSTVSSIGFANDTLKRREVVNETVVSAESYRSTPTHPSPGKSLGAQVSPSAQLLDTLNQLDLKTVKAAGHFLDGCKVYLSGFAADSSEKLRRVLNAGGATRFNEISDSVSHVIIGSTSLDELEQMLRSCVHRPFVVSLKWLFESIKIQGRAPEEDFVVTSSSAASANPEPPSPSLKKSLAMLRTPIVPPLVLEPPPNEVEAAAGTLIPQYLGNGGTGASKDGTLFKVPQNRPEPEAPSSSLPDDEESQVENFFEGLKFLLVGFDDEDDQVWTEMIDRFGGEIVGDSYRGVPDYGIVPFCGAVVRHATKEVVTDLWLESCSYSNAKVPVAYYHLPVAAPSVRPLTGFILCFSSYVAKERDYLVQLSEVLGAVSQEVFARKDCAAKNVRGSTHLICSEPGSTKYSAAIKWGLPAVSHKWLLACLRERKAVDTAPYVVTEATTLSPTVAEPAPTIKSMNGSLDKSAKARNSRNQIETLSAAPSPIPNASPLPSETLCTTLPATEPNRTPGSGNLNITPLNKSTSSATPSMLDLNVTPGPSSREAAQNYGFSQETPIRFPRLAGASTRVSSGGKVDTPEMTTPTTPYAFGYAENPSPATRKAMKRWIEKIPNLQRPASPEPPSKRRKSTPVNVLFRRCWDKWSNITGEQKEPAAEDDAQSDSITEIRGGRSTEDDGNGSPNVAKEGAGAYTQLNQLDQLLKASTSNGGSGSEDAAKLPRRSSLMEEAAAKAAATTRAALDDKAVEAGVKESQWSQSNDVGWEFNERRVDSREASPNGQSRPSVPDNERQYKVILSTMSGPDREKYKKIVVSLGGMVSEEIYFDLSATHLVCMKPSRSEKMLACIASGKWVMHSSYLDESSKAGYFLQEEKFEFGNPAAVENLPSLKSASMEQQLAAACFRWRKRLENNTSEKGAYHGISAIIWTNPEKIDSFKRLLLAGGGTIVDIRPPFTTRTSATHLFIDGSKTKVEIDYQALVNHGVLCVPLMFLNNFLVEFPVPVAEEHLLPEVFGLKPKRESQKSTGRVNTRSRK